VNPNKEILIISVGATVILGEKEKVKFAVAPARAGEYETIEAFWNAPTLARNLTENIVAALFPNMV
jgi:hypothetical protein